MILVIGTFFYFTAIDNDNTAEMEVLSQPLTNVGSQEQMLSNEEASNEEASNDIPIDDSMLEKETRTSVTTDSRLSEVNAPTTKSSGSSGGSSTGSSSGSSSGSLFDHLLQDEKMFTKKNADGDIKLFYRYTREEQNGDDQVEIQLDEGNINSYLVHVIGGQNYYPLILGYEEAKKMRDEGLFTEIGDPIKDFFGKNVVVVGVMKKTNGALDMAYLIPLNSGELN